MPFHRSILLVRPSLHTRPILLPLAIHPPRPIPLPLRTRPSSTFPNRPLPTPLTPPPPPSSPPPQMPNLGQDFSIPLLYTVRTIGKLFKLFAYGILIVVGVGGAGWEGAHLWVEYRGLPGDHLLSGEGEEGDWGWGKERDRWTGGSKGGTDPRLGWVGRHVVRSAWMAMHWGTGPEEMFPGESRASGGGGRGGGEGRKLSVWGFGVPAREWAYARAYLGRAMEVARERGVGETDRTMLDLLSLYAHTLSLIGNRPFLLEAKEAYVRVVKGLLHEGRREEAARVGWRVGELERRVGGEGEGWWVWAMGVVRGKVGALPGADAGAPAALVDEVDIIDALPTPTPPTPPSRPSWFSFFSSAPPAPSQAPTATATPTPALAFPPSLPPTPHAQRTLLLTLLSLSSSLSSHPSHLPLAHTLQTTTLSLLSPTLSSLTTTTTTSPSPPSPAKHLHLLSLQHYTALLQSHLAETTHALSLPSPTPTPLQSLLSSATLSESLIQTLTSSPPTHPDFPLSPLPPPPTPLHTPLSPRFSQSPTLRTPATRLLRDARRAAAHAWSLAGVLYEMQGEEAKGLECAERAVGWLGGLEHDDAGVERVGGGAGGAGERVGPEGEGLESERRAIWERWRRIRGKVLEAGGHVGNADVKIVERVPKA